MDQAEAKQFKLMDNGEVFFQPNPTNPLPGDKIATLVKGDSIFYPKISLEPSSIPEGKNQEETSAFVLGKVHQNITETLELLYKLNEDVSELPPSVQGILQQLSEAMGFMPRPQVDHLITELDSDGRYALRKKGVKLGPLLVFIPQLGKPAAVKMRALLWTIWHDGTLPASVPRDGSVSQIIEGDAVDRNYYRMIGYPVFGGRAIRADMLDRIVNEIYDTAKDGKFKAQHKMAEWLGCTIPELYTILTDLGHKKIYDPADQAEATEPTKTTTESTEPAPLPAQEEAATTAPAESTPSEDAKTEETPSQEATSEDTPKPEASTPEKPELAVFAIKRGKAADRIRKKSTHGHQKKDFSKQEYKSDKKSSFKVKDKKKPKKDEQRVIHAGPKKDEEDSPFAVLKDLKIGNEK